LVVKDAEGVMGGVLGYGRKVWRFLASINTAVVCLLVLVALSALLSFLPQLSPEIKASEEALRWWRTSLQERYGAFYPLADFLGLFSAYDSPWFRSLVLFILIGAVVCTVNRWPALWRSLRGQHHIVMAESFYRTGPFTVSLSPLSPTELSRILRRLGFRVFSREEGGLFYFFADRNNWARLGTFVTHLSLVLIVVGFAWSLLGRQWEITPPLIPGGDVYRVGGKTLLRLMGFRLEQNSDGTVRDYRCYVKISGSQGREVQLRVGQPLMLGATWVLLYSYGPAWTVEAMDNQGQLLLLEGEGRKDYGTLSLPFPKQGEIKDVAIPSRNIGLELSVQPQGLFVRVSTAGGEVAFEDFVRHGQSLTVGDARLRFSSGHYVVLKLLRDPGFPLSVLGAVLLVVGVLTSLYFPYVRVWGCITGEEVRLRGDRAFSSREWARLVSKLSGEGG